MTRTTLVPKPPPLEACEGAPWNEVIYEYTVAGFQALVPGARFEVIEDAAHGTISKKPEQYMASGFSDCV